MFDIELLCKQVLSAREIRDEVKEKLRSADTEVNALEAKLSEAMLQNKETKCSADGFTFSAAPKVGWKTLPDNREDLVKLLKQGAPQLVKETVNPASLASYLRKNESSLESANEAWWQRAKGYLVRTEIASLSVRKIAKKKK